MIISKDKKLVYLEEMIQPYEKNHEKKYFIEQYLRGSGNELSGKFWELKSSSRLAYDLYSWMKDDERILDFEFEYQLPNLRSGGIGPNMDVFIETIDELIFIESKFTEKANLHFIDNGYLKEAYYADKPYGRKQMGLKERFNGSEWAQLFSDFCYKWENRMNEEGWHNGKDWFEPKQETCHLSGILLYLFDKQNRHRIQNKKIRLFNIYWHMLNDRTSVMEQEFCQRAQHMLDVIISNNNPGIIDFRIDAFSVQDMLRNGGVLSSQIVFSEELEHRIFKRNEEILKVERISSR
jgi:hypothetical protein